MGSSGCLVAVGGDVGFGVPVWSGGVGSAEEAGIEGRGFVGTLGNPALLGRNYKRRGTGKGGLNGWDEGRAGCAFGSVLLGMWAWAGLRSEEATRRAPWLVWVVLFRDPVCDWVGGGGGGVGERGREVVVLVVFFFVSFFFSRVVRFRVVNQSWVQTQLTLDNGREERLVHPLRIGGRR